MPFSTRSRRANWVFLGIIFLLAALILWRAPAERTLGNGILSVYVHVALTWTGMVGILAAGLLGAVAALFGRPQLQSWAYTVTWVALGTFCAVLVMSTLAAAINWGGVFWQEPRFTSALMIVAAGLVVQVIGSWSVAYRLKGLLNGLLALFLVWTLPSTRLVLHPGNAARTTESTAIRFTFFGLFILCCLFAAWLVVYIQQRRQSDKGTKTRLNSQAT